MESRKILFSIFCFASFLPTAATLTFTVIMEGKLDKKTLISPRIHILHLPERKRDAYELEAICRSLGARVTMVAVSDKVMSQRHRGRLYYFDETARSAEIAAVLARVIRQFERVAPRYAGHDEPMPVYPPNYVIWIVRNPILKERDRALLRAQRRKEREPEKARRRKEREEARERKRLEKEAILLSAEQSAMAAAEEEKNPQTICHQCRVVILKKRLGKHILKAHAPLRRIPRPLPPDSEPTRHLFKVTKLSKPQSAG